MKFHRLLLPVIAGVLLLPTGHSIAADFPQTIEVGLQPLKSQVKRVVEAMDYLGFPLTGADRKELEVAVAEGDESTSREGIQKVLDRYALYGVQINPEMRVKVSQGPAKAVLHEQGWVQFLVKVHNESGTTAELKTISPQAASLHNSAASEFPDRWLDVQMFNDQPLAKTLSGLELEYRIVQLYSRDPGRRAATMSFNVGQGTQDIGYRNEVDVLFDCQPAVRTVFRVKDENGEPATAGFEIRDQGGRVYPSQAKRSAPDFSFHPQVYRADGEEVRLPAGQYTINFGRGPESIPEKRQVTVDAATRELSFQVKRWIDPSLMGWWSGDHHIHAAGCAHYTKPTEGVHAPDMQRHIMGEDLKIGANLTWGPCFDYQKQFFTGKDSAVSQYPYLLRYDIEVSGFGSHESGHLCLLRLRDQMYPGGTSMQHWPKLGLNTLKWAKAQGALVGPAHSGWGLATQSTELPNYEVPPFDGIGANEYIVDVTHTVPGPDGQLVPAVDFLSTVDTPYLWELNIWYHTLNVGFRTRISGETDFPCIYGEKVGLGRSYVHLRGKLDYEAWCEGIRAGRNYVGDGKSHLIGFKADKLAMGEGDSTLRLEKAGAVKLTAKVAAMLPEVINPYFSKKPNAAPPWGGPGSRPFWSVEWARLGETRKVPVEVIVNGYPVARQEIEADGHLQDVTFDVPIKKSSWVALRILQSSHTNPIFIEVGGQPIRASVKSAEWCAAGVKQCRSQKERFMDADEKADFHAAYDHAGKVYAGLIEECRKAEQP
ncbi:MAG: CehA/McbA family metallohydrolase [Verrucomicrobiota bacterium]